MRGRKPTPEALKKLRGNPGRRPIKRAKPKRAAAITMAPRYLNSVARDEWRRLMPNLSKLGLFTALDVDALAAYCIAYADWRRCNKELESGLTYTTNSGAVRRKPEVGIRKEAVDIMAKYAGELGLTPTARLRLTGSATIPTPESEIRDGWDDLD